MAYIRPRGSDVCGFGTEILTTTERPAVSLQSVRGATCEKIHIDGWLVLVGGEQVGAAAGRGLGDLVRTYRRRAGFTQRELADLSGLSVASLRDLEQGRVRCPRPATVRGLGAALRLAPGELQELIERTQQRQASGADVLVEVLGPLRVFVAGKEVDPGSRTQRMLLAMLALSPNVAVGREELATMCLDDSLASRAPDVIQSRVSRLRKRLHAANEPGSDTMLAASRFGYTLKVFEGQHDLLLFRGRVARARNARDRGDLVVACDALRDAVGLVRGDPTTDLPVSSTHPAVAALAREIEAVVVEYAEVAEDLGRHDEVIEPLRRLISANPLHEKAHARLIVALAGAGRQAAALTLFEEIRTRLVAELGADPASELVEAHVRVLRQEVTVHESATVSAHRQLPADIAEFTGRTAELAALREGLRTLSGGTAVPILIVEGMGGVGKTRLAVHLAHQLLAGADYADQQFADQQFYVDLQGHADQEPADPSAVLESFLRLLGVASDQIPRDLESRSALYRDRLHDRSALVLLDNAASEQQVYPLIPASPTNLVIVTSRRALALDGAFTLALDVFTEAEARELLTTVIGRERVADDATAERRVVELCGRLPLAVALAARRLQARPAWTLADLVARIIAAGDRIGELAAGSRQLRTVFDLSYGGLDPAARRQFRILGWHPGETFTVESAAALAGTSPAHARERVDGLVDEHVVTMVNAGRYQLHDLLREYAATVADRDEPTDSKTAGLTRLLDYYLHTAAAAADMLQPHRWQVDLVGTSPAWSGEFAGRDDADRWFENERGCLVSAVKVAADNGMAGHAWQLAYSLRTFLSLHGYTQDLLRVLEAALAPVVATQNLVGEAALRTYLAGPYMYLSRFEEAHDQLRRALQLHRREGDRTMELTAVGWMGVVNSRLGRFHEALRYIRRAAEMSAGSDPYREGLSLHNLGSLLTMLGNLDEALENYRRALVIARQLRDEHMEGTTLADIGDICRRLGRHEEALGYLRESLAVTGESTLKPWLALVRFVEGATYRELGRFGEAFDCLNEALQSVRDVSSPVTESDVLVELAATYRATDDFTAAHDVLRRARVLAIEALERYQEARAVEGLAQIHFAMGELEAARAYWHEAYDLFAELGTGEVGAIRQRLGLVGA